VLEAKSPAASAIADPEVLRSSLRAFGRLRQQADADGALQDPDPGQGATSRPEVLPIDSTKTFVGPNTTYYDEHWRSMEWRETSRSWNWAAALSMGGWLAYRRLYDHAVLHSVWLTLLILLALSGIPLKFLLPAQVLVAVLCGVYANAWYRSRFRRAAETAGRHDGEYAAQLGVLAAAGGTSRRAVWLMVGAMVAVSACLVAFRRSLNGVELML
jgi:Protein of unknown function (DUF2628)